MAATSSFFYKNSKEVTDSIDFQFKLEPHTLIRLAKAFLNEFHTGLGKYGEPMAMMFDFQPSSYAV